MVGLILDERAAARTASNRQSGRIVVVGIGDDGRNRVQLMSSHNVPDVSYIVVDADTGSPDIVEHDFELIQVTGSGHERHHILDTDIEFMGTRRNDAYAPLRSAMANAELVFITAGMNRNVNLETVALVSSIAKETQALVVGVVTSIFSFEESTLGHAVSGAD